MGVFLDAKQRDVEERTRFSRYRHFMQFLSLKSRVELSRRWQMANAPLLGKTGVCFSARFGPCPFRYSDFLPRFPRFPRFLQLPIPAVRACCGVNQFHYFTIFDARGDDGGAYGSRDMRSRSSNPQ